MFSLETQTNPAAAAGLVANAIHDAERSIDLSMIRLAVLLQALPEARLNANLGANVGQRALEDLGAAVQECIRTRGSVGRMHARISRDATLLGIDVTTLTGGADKGADDDVIVTPRPQGRLVPSQ